MATITFDTQELVRELKSAGVSPEQADAIVRVIVKSHGDLVTKSDLLATEQRIVIRLGTLSAALTGIAVALLKFAH